ncbi:S8 family serine peptidase [Amycolatopsis sp. NPDC049159]|uniref:S8 family peptidase n=1 Tax=Amycolatopsis sp. NPDC049159 TaxID=3157210 RepID=UPI0033DB67B8
MTWRSRVFALACTGALVAALGQAVPAAADPAVGAPPRNPGERHSVTLLTGDVVQVESVPGGRRIATVRPGKDRESIRFSQSEVDGKLVVVPSDAMRFVAAKRLDKDLFDVTGLIAQGYADEAAAQLPLIVHYAEGMSIAAAPTLAGTERGAELPSVHGRAVREDKKRAGEFWRSFTGPQAASGAVERISLDRKVHASLDRSVPQIGAPEAWAAGYDGSGVKVAVLDTGFDATHPDLAGRVEKTANFSSSADMVDRFGHGTHVASTIAGSGAADAGKRKGAAPGAKLYIGKVLGDDGSATSSEVLQGMEWAAATGAKVINMSLGGGATDGTDDLSVALNELSARTGALFVVAAGNDGRLGPETIGTPGTADAALTVGAVDRQDQLAPFSSTGPRLGDQAVKPDITAPGVDIVAARAAGTSMGAVVDQYYTAASGTSMATPHVAGAAAILAQRYPQWTGQQLKDGLASTAKPTSGLTVFQQGGGRVDLTAAAVKPGVFATGTLNIGPVTGESGTVRKEVSYTNTTSAPVTLTPRLDLHRPGGSPPGAAIKLDKSTVDVPAGGTATVGIIVDPAALAPGNYTGSLLAGAVHTTIGLVKEAPKHKLTVSGLDRAGKTGDWMEIDLFGPDSRYDIFGDIREATTFELPEGDYYARAVFHTGLAPDEELAIVVKPEVPLTQDAKLVMDARAAVPVEIKTPRPATLENIISSYTHREFGDRNVTNYIMEFPGTRHIYVTPTRKVTKGTFEFGTRWQLTAPMVTATVLPWTGLEPELFTLGPSPAISGTSWLAVAPVDGNKPDQWGTARGKIALVTPPDDGGIPEEIAAAAAKAGAAMVIMIIRPGDHTYAHWSPRGDRLPIPAMMVTNEQGVKLVQRAKLGFTSMVLRGTPVSPYLYDVLQVSRDQIPQRVVHEVSDRNSATVKVDYPKTGDQEWLSEQRFGWRPWEKYATNQYQRFAKTASTREEIVSADDTIWQHRVYNKLAWNTFDPLANGQIGPPRTFRPGERASERWYTPVVRPAIPRGAGLTSSRTGDTFAIRIPEYVDAEAGHYAFADTEMDEPEDQLSAKLYRDGQLVEDGRVAWGSFPADAGPATYRLDVAVAKAAPEWQFGTRTETSWTFASQRPAGTRTDLLPLLQVDFGVQTDLTQRTRAGRPDRLEFTVRNQDGMAAPKNPKLTVEVSFDDGRTWTAVNRVDSVGDGKFRAKLDVPKRANTNGFVALRVNASDGANAVRQTVIRAYGLS